MNNVFEEGFLHAGITLAARLLSSPQIFLTNYNLVLPGNQRIAFRYFPDGSFGVVPAFVPDPGGPFPYGQSVEPP